MNQKIIEMKKNLANMRSEMEEYLNEQQSATTALSAAQELLATAQSKAGVAHSALGKAVVKDRGEEEARVAFDAAQLEMERAQFKLSAVQAIVDKVGSHEAEQRYASCQRNVQSLLNRIREEVAAEESSKMTEKAMAPLIRAWSFQCGPGNGHGFGLWLAERYVNFTIRPEEMKRLNEEVHAEYGV